MGGRKERGGLGFEIWELGIEEGLGRGTQARWWTGMREAAERLENGVDGCVLVVALFHLPQTGMASRRGCSPVVHHCQTDCQHLASQSLSTKQSPAVEPSTRHPSITAFKPSSLCSSSPIHSHISPPKVKEKRKSNPKPKPKSKKPKQNKTKQNKTKSPTFPQHPPTHLL